jgi:hypothetical protein
MQLEMVVSTNGEFGTAFAADKIAELSRREPNFASSQVHHQLAQKSPLLRGKTVMACFNSPAESKISVNSPSILVTGLFRPLGFEM